MSHEKEEANVMLYMLAGVGLGAIIGAAADVSPKAGTETREELANKFKELKGKTEEWVSEQRAKRSSQAAVEELGV